MAGIGFELKRLFKHKGLLPGIRANLFSAIIAVGPTLFCILMLTVLQKLLAHLGTDFSERELFMAAVIYSFVFSLLMTSGLTMVLSRYTSDKMFENKYEDILPSLNGAIILCMIFGGVAGLAFYWRSPLGLPFKLVAYILFMELNIIWLQMVYLSALQDYLKPVKGFFIGVVTSLFLAYVLISILKVNTAAGVIAAIDTGFLILLIFFAVSIKKYFGTPHNNNFDFLRYFDKYPSLFFTGFFYVLGLYVHNFVFWKGSHRIMVYGTYVLAPFYDVPVFWAFLSIIPAMVIFVVSFETEFYEKYKAFYATIYNGGIMKDITGLKNEMQKVLSHCFRHMMSIQLIFTIMCLALGIFLLPMTGLTGTSVRIFNMLVIGDYAFIIMYICILVLLYFDDRRGALAVSAVFVASNALLTGVTASWKESCYGLGFVAAAYISLAVGYGRLNTILKNIEYFTFCSQPVMQQEDEKIFTRLSKKIYRVLGGTAPQLNYSQTDIYNEPYHKQI